MMLFDTQSRCPTPIRYQLVDTVRLHISKGRLDKTTEPIHRESFKILGSYTHFRKFFSHSQLRAGRILRGRNQICELCSLLFPTYPLMAIVGVRILGYTDLCSEPVCLLCSYYVLTLSRKRIQPLDNTQLCLNSAAKFLFSSLFLIQKIN